MGEREVTTVRYIWKCRNRDCKHVFALDYWTMGQYSVWRCVGDEVVVFMDDVNGLCCLKCSWYRPKPTRVYGVYSVGRKCSVRCLGATGGMCECECGGKNHGAGYL